MAHARPTLRATVPDGRCSAFHALGRCHSPVLVVLRAAAVQFISANKDIQKNGLDLAFSTHHIEVNNDVITNSMFPINDSEEGHLKPILTRSG